MKPLRSKRIRIPIHVSAKTVTDFLLNPENTPKWIDAIVHEETNEWPVKEGSIYRNKSSEGVWHTYVLTSLEPRDRGFILTENDGNYHVRYTVTPVSDAQCELEYYEWVIRGTLPQPLPDSALHHLKTILENQE